MANQFHGLDGSGSLDDGNYSLDLLADDGTSTRIEPSIETIFTGSFETTLSLKSTVADRKFRGFLLRLSAKNDPKLDVSSFLIVHSSSKAFAKPLNICEPFVAGLTHKDPMDKNEIKVVVQHNANVELVLEVTVVEKNNPSGSNLWFYNRFEIQLQGANVIVPYTSIPDIAATSVPSMQPSKVSDFPSAGTTESFSPSSTPSMSAVPTVSIAPSSLPSESHVPTVSIVPSSLPSTVRIAPSSLPSESLDLTNEDQSQSPSVQRTNTGATTISSASGLFRGNAYSEIGNSFGYYGLKLMIQMACILGLQYFMMIIL